jgi:hypothetical protein
MRSTRSVVALAGTFGSLAAAWFAGAAPIWQGFGFHLHG